MAQQANPANIKSFPMGAVIIRAGADAPKEMIVLLQGNIGVYRDYKMNTEICMRVLSQGSFHGEKSLFVDCEQRETLVALTEVLVLVVSRKNVREFLLNQPDMALSIIEGIVKRMHDADTLLEMLQGSTAGQAESRRSKLFPENHGSYTLPLTNDSDKLYMDKKVCPLCKHSFESYGIIQSKLRLEQTDPDMRPHYQDFEPLFYDIITCPNCFLSTAASAFDEVSKSYADRISQSVGPYKLEMYIRAGNKRDTFTVFAGYYLAMLCAPVISDDSELIIANLWLKLSWIYQICADDAMEAYATQQALETYENAYQTMDISGKRLQNICYLLGELYLKTGNSDKARDYFFMAKTNNEGTPVMKRQADMRLDHIRDLRKAEVPV